MGKLVMNLQAFFHDLFHWILKPTNVTGRFQYPMINIQQENDTIVHLRHAEYMRVSKLENKY